MSDLPANEPDVHIVSNSETGRKIRLMVVDDHEIVRKGLIMLLGLEPDIEICGEASDGRAAYELARLTEPDIVLMDFNMPTMSGVEAARLIKTTLPHCKVLILTGVDIDARILEAVQSGIDGYVLKEVRSAVLAGAVRTVAAGGAYLDPTVTRKMLGLLSKSNTSNLSPSVSLSPDHTHSQPSSEQPGYSDLTLPVIANSWVVGTNISVEEELSERELEVLRSVALGQSNREIGETLIITEGTVRTHLKTIFRKLRVNDRTQAVVIGLRRGLIEL